LRFGRIDAGTNSITHRYLYGNAVDQVFADERYAPGGGNQPTLPGDLRLPIADHLNTPRDLVDSTGAVINHLAYDSFGQVKSETNGAIDYLFGFGGFERDESTGLLHSDTRYYHPALGRWISEDPVGFAGGDANLVRYVGNGPTNAIDPSGLEKAWIIYGILGYEMEEDPATLGRDPWGESPSPSIGGLYASYLTEPSSMDRELEYGFYGAVGTAGVAGTAAGGLWVAGYGAVTVSAAAAGAAPIVASEVLDTAVEEGASAVTGVPVILPLSPADLLQDSCRVVLRKVPNPFGKLGSPAHRAKVAERAAELRREGYDITGGGGLLPESAVETLTGRRFPDISATGPTGELYFENVGRRTRAGDPVARERRALDDIEAATGRRPTFTPYD
jgi:RHS repeat-associated protein